MDATDIGFTGDSVAKKGLNEVCPTAAPVVKGEKDLEGIVSLLPWMILKRLA